MKISELIRQLSVIQDQQGDIEVMYWGGQEGVIELNVYNKAIRFNDEHKMKFIDVPPFLVISKSDD